MPIIDSDTPAPSGPLPTFPAEAQAPIPSALDVADAAERQTPFGRMVQNVEHFSDGPSLAAEPGYNPIDHIPQGLLHDYGREYVHLDSPAQVAAKTAEIRDRINSQQVIARAGGWGLATSFALGTVDPINLATMALAPEAAPTRVGNAIRWALTNSAVTAGQDLLEAGEGADQSIRGSALNIGAGAILGGLLGPFAPRVPAGRLASVVDRLGEELHAPSPDVSLPKPSPVLGPVQRSVLADVERPVPEDLAATLKEEGHVEPEPLAPDNALPGEPAYVNPEMESTMGAAAVKGATLEDLSVARGAKAYSATVGQMAPAQRLMQSESVKARRLTAELANLPGNLEMNYKDIASPNPVERTLWKDVEGTNTVAIDYRRARFSDYLQRVKEAGEEPIDRQSFMEEIAKALRRGDKSSIPEVAKSAQWMRANIYEPTYQRAVKAGMVDPEARLNADSYLTRLYDYQKIRANYGQWIETLRQHFIGQGVDPAEATDVAHAVDRNIAGGERGQMDWKVTDGIVPKSGRLKERSLSMPDTQLEPFLSNDIDHLTHSYLRSMVPELEMTERFGSRDLKDQFGEITDEYSHLIEQARATGDNERAGELNAARDKDLKTLGAIRDRLYGIYGAPKDPGAWYIRAGRLARQANVFRMLGGATLSHFPDIANMMARYGMGNTFATMGKLATSLDAIKINIGEAHRLGVATDMVMNTVTSILGDFGTHSRYAEQRFTGSMARGFTIATGETPLIAATQAVASAVGQQEILRSAERVLNGETLGKNLAARLASGGLDTEALKRIGTAAAPKMKEVNGLRFGMSDTWEDQGAARLFESAVARDAHAVTLRPGVGDTPLFMSTELGKLIGQFKSFAFAANRVVGVPTLQGLAHGDMRAVQAMLALTAMGTLSYVAKQKAAGQPIEANPGRLAGEVADKSNLLGWTGELIFPALYAMGFNQLSRWSDRDPAETFLGPTIGTAAAAWGHQFPSRIQQGISGGPLPGQEDLPFRRSDLHFLRKLMPANQLWYARRAINHLEDGIGDLFNLPGESNAERESRLADNVTIQ